MKRIIPPPDGTPPGKRSRKRIHGIDPADLPKEAKEMHPLEVNQLISPSVTHLTDKHLYFCKRVVLNGGNISKAARESGFNVDYALGQLSKNKLIKDEIERYRSIRAKKFDVNADRVIKELVKIAFGTLGDFMTLGKDGTPVIDCSEVGMEEMAALSEVTQDSYEERTGPDGEDVVPVKKTKLKMHNKIAALDQLARIFKLFGDDGADDKQTPEEKAQRIREVLRKMEAADGV